MTGGCGADRYDRHADRTGSPGDEADSRCATGRSPGAGMTGQEGSGMRFDVLILTKYLAAAALLAVTGCTTVDARAAERLPVFGADPAQVTVSGLSSGAFMTVQFHVAFS